METNPLYTHQFYITCLNPNGTVFVKGEGSRFIFPDILPNVGDTIGLDTMCVGLKPDLETFDWTRELRTYRIINRVIRISHSICKHECDLTIERVINH